MNMAGPLTSEDVDVNSSSEQLEQPLLKRLMPRDEYLEKAREADLIDKNLSNIDTSNHARTMGMMDIANKKRRQGNLEAQVATSLNEMFNFVDVSEMSEFFNLVAGNARRMGDKDLVWETETMGKRGADQAKREYPKTDAFSDEARLCEEIALYLGNRYEEPALIKLNFADKNTTYYPRHGDQKQETPDKVALLYNLLGIGEEIDNIPEFTKEAKSLKSEDTVVPSRSFLLDGFNREVVGTFIFIRPHTIPAEGAQKEKYVPLQVGLQLNQIPEDQELPKVPSASDKKHSVVVLPDFQPKLMREGALRWY